MEPMLDDDEKDKKEKRSRKRHRKLIGAVQSQLEFYFGDANLRHDRFLRKEIETNTNGYVAVNILMKFNRLKEMVEGNSGYIVKAAKNSEFLEVDEQETRIRRVKAVPGLLNTDPQTVYVEHLPATADHDWLRNVFSTCGTVEYISLPRFKHTGEIKGFAFIEYSTAEDAEKACRVLNTLFASKDKHKEAENYGQTMRTENISTANEITDHQQSNIGNDNDNTSQTDLTTSVEGTPKKDNKSSKRRRCQSESETSDMEKTPSKKKRRKTTSESLTDDDKFTTFNDPNKFENKVESSLRLKDVNTDVANIYHQKRKKRKRNASSSCSETLEDQPIHNKSNKISNDSINKNIYDTKLSRNGLSSEKEQDASDGTLKVAESDSESKSTKSHKKKRKRNKKTKEKEEIDIPPLYVISKAEWVAMKKRYKDLQRQEMNILKGNLAIETEDTEYKNPLPGIKSKETPGPRIPLNRGTVLRINCKEEDVSRNSVRSALPESTKIAYIDLKDGAKEGYLRFHSREDANFVLEKQDSKLPFFLSELSAALESEYFHKIEADRKGRYERKKPAGKKERGIEKVKIKKKIEKAKKKVEEDLMAKKQHVFFTEGS